MTLRGEYTTVTELRSTYLAATQTTDDTLLLDMIRAISRDMCDLSGKEFHPRVRTLYFDLPCDRQLDFDTWVLAVVTLANGNGDAISSTEYDLVPKNDTPHFALRLKASSSEVWELDDDGNSENVVALTCITGYHRSYADAWEDTLGVLAGAIATTAATSFTVTTGTVKAGQLLKIDSEFLYASAVATGATDTVTVVRGVNGSTAATHLINAPVYKWAVGDSLSLLCRQATAATYKLRENPSGESVVIDGNEFRTPRDVRPWLAKQIAAMGLVALS